jgi:Holliday junction resolvase-like predicted endonuclease
LLQRRSARRRKEPLTVSTPISVRKHSGELDVFSEDKLRSSLQNAGANAEVSDYVLSEVSESLYDGISTGTIYKMAFQVLKRKKYVHASKYRLKRSIQELGPTGYPFEVFVAEIMKAEGFTIQVGLNMKGKCVAHEVDVLAENEHQVLMMECKFHNKPGYKSDVKVPLYINARFHDLNDVWKDTGAFGQKKTQGCVVTNSRFTQDAIDYGTCAGMQMISWDYPNHASIKKRANEHLLYPITSLQSLSKQDKKMMIEEGIIVTKSLCENFDLLDKLGYPKSKIKKIVLEANLICEL